MGGSDVEFFGVKLKVANPHLAALLNSSITEDVEVVGRRARDAFANSDDDARAERPLAAAGRVAAPPEPVVERPLEPVVQLRPREADEITELLTLGDGQPVQT